MRDIIYLNFPFFLFISSDLTFVFTLDSEFTHLYAKILIKKELLEKLKFNFTKKKFENNYSCKNGKYRIKGIKEISRCEKRSTIIANKVIKSW